MVQQPQEKALQGTYSLESLRWEAENDFSCEFCIRMNGECSIDSFFAIQEAFESNIRSAYCRMHPSMPSNMLVVDARPNLENERIVGRAVVLTIEPKELSYDATTRRGLLSVRFNSGQYEDARLWIRRNIETLARDKNIAITTGEHPPASRYYSLGERVVDGNIMEIEFRTE